MYVAVSQAIIVHVRVSLHFQNVVFRNVLSFSKRERFCDFHWGPFQYYVIKEVGGWGQKMEILDDLQYCKSSKSWVGGPKKVKNTMT